MFEFGSKDIGFSIQSIGQWSHALGKPALGLVDGGITREMIEEDFRRLDAQAKLLTIEQERLQEDDATQQRRSLLYGCGAARHLHVPCPRKDDATEHAMVGHERTEGA